MKKSIMIFLIAAMLVVIVGCGFFPSEPPIEEPEEEIAAPEEPAEQPEQLPEPEAAEEIEPVVEEEIAAEPEEKGPEISGSLDLQENLALCPHLAESFECNKYDIRRCNFNTFVGKNEFYPDLMNCRDGYTQRGENPDNKYCIIQECRPLQEENIAYAYGGPIAYAEYDYSVEQIEGGIMTHYTLLRCGETHKEFDTDFDCTVYKSELEGLWVD